MSTVRTARSATRGGLLAGLVALVLFASAAVTMTAHNATATTSPAPSQTIGTTGDAGGRDLADGRGRPSPRRAP